MNRLVILFLFVVVGAHAHAQSSDKLQDDTQSKLNQIESIENELYDKACSFHKNYKTKGEIDKVLTRDGGSSDEGRNKQAKLRLEQMQTVKQHYQDCISKYGDDCKNWFDREDGGAPASKASDPECQPPTS